MPVGDPVVLLESLPGLFPVPSQAALGALGSLPFLGSLCTILCTLWDEGFVSGGAPSGTDNPLPISLVAICGQFLKAD